MKKKGLLSIMLLVCFIVGISGTLTSCKDYDDDAEWKEDVASNKSLIDALQQQVANLTAAQTQCHAQCDRNKDSLVVLDRKIESLSTTVGNNSTEILNLKNDVRDINQKITNLESADSLLKQAINDANKRIDSTNRNVEALKNGVAANTDSINKLRDRLATCINNCNATALKVSGLIEKVGGLESTISILNNTVTGLQNDVKELFRKAYNDSVAAAKADAIAKDANNKAQAALDSINQNIRPDLNNLAATLGTVKDLAEANKTALDQLKERVDDLENLVKAIEDALKKQVTSIAVNGTYNPIFGYYAVPSGDIRSTVLGAYYGNPAQFQFPTATAGYYVDPQNRLSVTDISITGTNPETLGGSTIVAEDGAAGNAGTMWLTLNPTEVDLTGKTFSLVNSRGEESAMTLTSAQPSNELLQFGYTRAAGTNGFYATQGTVSKEAVSSLTPNVNLQDLKSEFRTLYNNWKNRNANGGMQVNLSQLAGVIYENINNVLPALALKTTWTSNDAQSHSVLSQYSVAAAAVHPLSYGFLYGKTATPLPVYTAYEDLNIKIDTIKLNPIAHLSDDDITVTIEYQSYNQDGTPKTETQTVKLTQLNEMIDRINGTLVGMMSQVNSQILDADDQLGHLQNLTNLFKTYDRWANRVNGWFSRDGNNDINRSLQPVLFYGSGNELRKVGNAKYGTVGLPSGTSLLATSYTLELLAPAYKKWVAVTNAWPTSADAVRGVSSAQQGNASALSALKAANTGKNMNQIVFGNVRSFTLGTLKSGYVYEIAYAAVDYNGKNVVRKFYVRGE